MKYYLITKEEYLNNHADCQHAVAYSIDGSVCILEEEESHSVENYIMMFNDSSEVNNFRYNESTGEAAKWIPTDEI